MNGPLTAEELYEHCDELDSLKCTNTFAALWAKEIKRKNPSVTRVIIKAYGAKFITFGVLYSFCESIGKYVNGIYHNYLYLFGI